MKSFIIFILSIIYITPLTLSAKDNHKYLNNIADKYIPQEGVMEVPNDRPENFWNALMAQNKNYQKAVNLAKKGKAKDIQREIGSIVSQLREIEFPVLSDSLTLAVMNDLVEIAGVRQIYPEHTLQLIGVPEENAYTFPNGAIYISVPLALKTNANPHLLLAIYAHEISHFILQHHFVALLAEKRKKERTKILNGISASVLSISSASADFYAATKGVPIDWRNTSQQIENYFKQATRSIERSSLNFAIRYNREQEFEADIVAYCFLEWLGVGGNHVIELLKLLDSDLEIFQNPGDSHPLTKERVALLEIIENRKCHNNKWYSPPREQQHDDIYNKTDINIYNTADF